jgi:hypothetical protein
MLEQLVGDPLRAIARLLNDDDLLCFRLVCTAFRDHSVKPRSNRRSAFLHSRARARFAWDELPNFVHWLRRHMLELAAAVGSTEVLAELVDARACALGPGGASVCAAAAVHGQLGALRWLRLRSCPWDANTSSCAAANGHLDVLRYAHEHGCPWTKWTCWYAARGGHLDALCDARSQGCPWDVGGCRAVASLDDVGVLRYLDEQQHFPEALEDPTVERERCRLLESVLGALAACCACWKAAAERGGGDPSGASDDDDLI